MHRFGSRNQTRDVLEEDARGLYCKTYGFLFYRKGENLRSGVTKAYFSVNVDDKFSLIQEKLLQRKLISKCLLNFSPFHLKRNLLSFILLSPVQQYTSSRLVQFRHSQLASKQPQHPTAHASSTRSIQAVPPSKHCLGPMLNSFNVLIGTGLSNMARPLATCWLS